MSEDATGRHQVHCGGEALAGTVCSRSSAVWEELVKLRQKQGLLWWQMSLITNTPMVGSAMTFAVEPQFVMGESCEDRNQAKSISIAELFGPQLDRKVLGRVLQVVVVEPPATMSAAHFIAEDAERSLTRIALYGWDVALLAKIGVGTVLSIYDPYCRMSAEGATIRVDDPKKIHFDEEKKMCWHCLTAGNNSYKLCGGCRMARYCSKECQLKDWREGSHKGACKSLAGRK